VNLKHQQELSNALRHRGDELDGGGSAVIKKHAIKNTPHTPKHTHISTTTRALAVVSLVDVVDVVGGHRRGLAHTCSLAARVKVDDFVSTENICHPISIALTLICEQRTRISTARSQHSAPMQSQMSARLPNPAEPNLLLQGGAGGVSTSAMVDMGRIHEPDDDLGR
jgi:hypothetical protein